MAVNKREVKGIIQQVLCDTADKLVEKEFKGKIRVGITLSGSDYGPEEVITGGEAAQAKEPDLEVICLGEHRGETSLPTLSTTSEKEHELMERLLEGDELDAAVTMQYTFPLGVATVGGVIAPGNGRLLLIATTTGLAANKRDKAMMRNAIYGLAVARTLGIEEPALGILNVEGAKSVQRALNRLKDGGYNLVWGKSVRGGERGILRGNDLLAPAIDVVVIDSLTGNIIMKLLSAYTSGGLNEVAGWGYGPGVGVDYPRIICIVSRAASAPVMANAIIFAARMVKGDLLRVVKEEFVRARKAGLEDICAQMVSVNKGRVMKLDPKPVTEEIGGVEILDLDDAVNSLAERGIYAEAGMGCTGPVILVGGDDLHRSRVVLKEKRFI